MPQPDDVHEWISFEDPGEHRTWLFDATYLRSNFTCIFGCGCQGILDRPAPELHQGCCSFGAHFADAGDLERVTAHVGRVRPEHMQFHAVAVEQGWHRDEDTDGEDEPAVVTTLVDDACIFLNRPGYAGGIGCALHIAAVEAGERPLDWKPEVCWQVPLRLEHSTDESGHLTSRLREWKRRDWGDGGTEFGWWCTESADAFVGAEPLYLSARDEIVALVGEDVYALMVDQLERPEWVPLPHPVTVRT